MKRTVKLLSLGLTDFYDVWNLQKEIFSLRKKNEIEDVLILTEHNDVYTIGKNGSELHLLANESELNIDGINVFNIDRGGDITFHGIGQIVGYPILNLENYYLDIHKYLRDIEEVIILTLKNFDINGRRDSDFTGVWVEGNKIAAIGINVKSWITTHGFALNVNTDLKYFEKIIPCGIFHKGVTSMEKVLNEKISLDKVQKKLVENFSHVFNVKIENIKEEFIGRLNNKLQLN